MKFILDKDKLEVQDEDEINSGSVQYYEVPVEHDTSWDDLTIEAVIAPKEGGAIIFDEAVSIAVVDRKIYIDRELSGSYAIGFKGYTIENEVKTYQISTNLQGIYFDIGAGQIIPTNSIPKPTEWEIYIAQMEAIANRAGQSAENAGISAQTATEQAGIATAQAEESARQAGISSTQAGISKDQADESTRQAGKSKDEADRAERARIGFEEEVQTATQNFNTNATNKTNAYNENASNKITAYNNNASDKLEAYNSNATNKTNAFNENASSKQGSFDTNATNKTNDFNTNASDKTTAFNNNATQKTTDFNNNATEKTGDYNSNATAKTTAFNENAQEKLEEFNENAESYNERITQLEADNESLIRTINNTTLDSTDTPSDNITLQDTGEGARLKKFALKGKTEQDSTTGKQLFNIDNVSAQEGSTENSQAKVELIANGFKITKLTGGTNGRISGYINCALSAGDYILSTNINTTSSNGLRVLGLGTEFGLYNNETTKTFTLATDITRFRFAYQDSEASGVYTEITNLMIRPASVLDDTYEPYTGGIPSPSPTYPQEIKNVKGTIQIKKCNKNKLDTFSHKNTVPTFLSFNEDGSFKINGTVTGNTSVIDMNNPISLPAGTYKFVSDFTITDGKLWFRNVVNGQGGNIYVSSYSGHPSQEFTIEEQTDFYMYITGLTNVQVNNVLIKPMVKLSSAGDDTWVPHAEKTYNFPLSEGQVLMQDGTIEDKVVNKWGEHIFTGEEQMRNFTSRTNTLRFFVVIPDKKPNSSSISQFLCNIGQGIPDYYYDHDEVGVCELKNASSNSLVFSLPITEVYDETTARAYFAQRYANGTPVKVQYRLLEPDETPFTPEQQAVYDEIIRDGTYEEVTHYSSNASINPDIEAVGIKSAKYEIEEIKSAIIALGGNLDV